jgi:hypothetical protein
MKIIPAVGISSLRMAKSIRLSAVIKMGEVVDINGKPSPEYISEDLYKFTFQYRVDDRYLALDIWAKTHEEAEAHVKALQDTIVYKGQLWSNA